MPIAKLFLLFYFIFFNLSFSYAYSQDEKEEKKLVPVEIKADKLIYLPSPDITMAIGKVEITYKEMKIKADYVEMDNKEELLYAQGNIQLTAEGQDLKGEVLKYDIKNKEGVVYKAEGFSDPIYFYGNIIKTSKTKVDISDSSATTCNKDNPHYSLSARKLILYPEDKAVAKKISFQLWGHSLFTFPVYVISLKEKKRQPFSPQFGRNQYEGWFIKTTYSYYLNPYNYGLLYLDWMEKKGVGKGIEQKISLAHNGEASLRIYHLEETQTNQTNLLVKGYYRQNFPKVLSIESNVDYGNQTTYYLQEIETLSSSLKLRKEEKNWNFSLTSQYRFLGGRAQQKDLKVTGYHQHHFPQKKINNFITFDYLSNKFGNNKPNLELNTQWQLDKQFPHASLRLFFQKRYDLDKDKYLQDRYYSALDKSPEISLLLPSLKFKNKTYPLSLQYLYAKYKESPRNVKQEKQQFKVSFNPRPYHLSSVTSFSQNITLVQDFYQNEDAKYQLNINSRLNNQHTKYFSTSLSHNFQEARGHSPFMFDRGGGFNNMQTNLLWNYQNRYIFSMNTGYDFLTKLYQYLIAKMDINQDSFLKLSLTAQYDLNKDKPLDLASTLRINKNKFSQTLNACYDMDRGRLKIVDLQINSKPHHFWQIEYKGAYDALRRRYTYNDFLITRDLHCWEARLSYRQAVKEVFLEFYIKAFPTEKVKLGVDERGMQYQTTLINF